MSASSGQAGGALAPFPVPLPERVSEWPSDGSENLVGALRQSMAALGATTIREMQQVEIVYAPAVATEGKSWQRP